MSAAATETTATTAATPAVAPPAAAGAATPAAAAAPVVVPARRAAVDAPILTAINADGEEDVVITPRAGGDVAYEQFDRAVSKLETGSCPVLMLRWVDFTPDQVKRVAAVCASTSTLHTLILEGVTFNSRILVKRKLKSKALRAAVRNATAAGSIITAIGGPPAGGDDDDADAKEDAPRWDAALIRSLNPILSALAGNERLRLRHFEWDDNGNYDPLLLNAVWDSQRPYLEHMQYRPHNELRRPADAVSVQWFTQRENVARVKYLDLLYTPLAPNEMIALRDAFRTTATATAAASASADAEVHTGGLVRLDLHCDEHSEGMADACGELLRSQHRLRSVQIQADPVSARVICQALTAHPSLTDLWLSVLNRRKGLDHYDASDTDSNAESESGGDDDAGGDDADGDDADGDGDGDGDEGEDEGDGKGQGEGEDEKSANGDDSKKTDSPKAEKNSAAVPIASASASGDAKSTPASAAAAADGSDDDGDDGDDKDDEESFEEIPGRLLEPGGEKIIMTRRTGQRLTRAIVTFIRSHDTPESDFERFGVNKAARRIDLSAIFESMYGPKAPLALSHRLQYINLSEGMFARTPAEERRLLLLLRDHPTLHSIRMRWCGLTDAAALALAEVIPTLPALHTFRASHNEWTDVGAVPLIRALTERASPTLTLIDVSSSVEIGIDSFRALDAGLSRNTTLYEAYMAQSHVGRIAVLLDTLRMNRTLHTLSVMSFADQNEEFETEEITQRVMKAMRDNPTLTESPYAVPDNHKPAFDALLRRNQLRKRRMEWNWCRVALAIAFIRANAGSVLRYSVLPLTRMVAQMSDPPENDDR